MFTGSRLEYSELTNPLKRKTIFGFVIPDFQRGLVWTEEQNISLINSIWSKIPIGTYTINDSVGLVNFRPENINIILDGQQRLNAIERYVNDKFKYRGFYWSELIDIDRRFFRQQHFPRLETRSDDINELKEYYNLMNFGGVKHTESDRA
jgi:hypothetical protein